MRGGGRGVDPGPEERAPAFCMTDLGVKPSAGRTPATPPGRQWSPAHPNALPRRAGPHGLPWSPAPPAVLVCFLIALCEAKSSLSEDRLTVS